MELRITTETGSIYFLSKNTMTWGRIKFVEQGDDNPYPVRTPGGQLTVWPEVRVGYSVDMMGPPLTPGATVRLVTTSRVVKVEEVSAN
jgi:hypothetical protein